MAKIPELPKGEKLKGSHVKQCSICKHKGLEDIERDFCMGRPVEGKEGILEQYNVTKMPLYNHMRARGFVQFRQSNPKFYLNWIIEHNVGTVGYRGSDIIAAVTTLMKAKGELGADTEVHITNQLDKLKDLSDEEVDRMLDELKKNANESETSIN